MEVYTDLEKTPRRSKGERVIRPDFAKTDEVREMKKLFALLYDKIDTLVSNVYRDQPHTDESFERMRCYNEALRNLETSSMYAVKGLTV